MSLRVRRAEQIITPQLSTDAATIGRFRCGSTSRRGKRSLTRTTKGKKGSEETSFCGKEEQRDRDLTVYFRPKTGGSSLLSRFRIWLVYG